MGYTGTGWIIKISPQNVNKKGIVFFDMVFNLDSFNKET